MLKAERGSRKHLPGRGHARRLVAGELPHAVVVRVSHVAAGSSKPGVNNRMRNSPNMQCQATTRRKVSDQRSAFQASVLRTCSQGRTWAGWPAARGGVGQGAAQVAVVVGAVHLRGVVAAIVRLRAAAGKHVRQPHPAKMQYTHARTHTHTFKSALVPAPEGLPRIEACSIRQPAHPRITRARGGVCTVMLPQHHRE